MKVIPYTAGGRTESEDPMKAFQFKIEIDGFGRRFGFQKCSKLSYKTQVATYWDAGNNLTPLKSVGRTEYSDITLERGQILSAGYGNQDILAWVTQALKASAKMSYEPFRRSLDIVQTDRVGVEVIRWRVMNAWPSEVSVFSDLDAEGSNNSIETMVLSHEGFYAVS